MAENDKQEGDTGNPQAGGFPLTVVSQYVKDLSFENPGGPDSLLTLKEVPHGTVRVDVRVQPRTPPEIEIVLFLAVEAKAGDKVVYVTECEYGGVFRLGRVSQESVLPLIMIEAPRLLFPFARQIVAETVQNLGFPPVLLDPIDFASAYVAQMESQQDPGQVTGQPGGDGDPPVGHA